MIDTVTRYTTSCIYIYTHTQCFVNYLHMPVDIFIQPDMLSSYVDLTARHATTYSFVRQVSVVYVVTDYSYVL